LTAYSTLTRPSESGRSRASRISSVFSSVSYFSILLKIIKKIHM
jgi:hypothetical protein